MNLRCCSVLALTACLLTGGLALADTTVTVAKVHLCCPQCVKTVEKVLGKIDGVTSEIDQKGKKVTITAKDDATAQKAVDAMVEAGFYGKTDSDKITVKKVTDLPKGKVSKVELTGIHNCCKQCTSAITKTVEKVAGVTGTDVAPKMTTFTVEGDFEPAAVVEALLKA